MKRFVRPGWAAGFLRGLGRSLICLGAIHTGPIVLQYYVLHERAPDPHARDPFARYAEGGLRLLPPDASGPSPYHPERLCADMSLSETEQLLARELWPPDGYRLL
ncbi:DUF6059 family protein [Streptomyces hyaluromycini]|uniref:DUF6059 family protein n=1 Tax=Streptomyces hyaluromycini TaxID=1377993 RepID=UPI000B5CAB9B|nr:DUF6059 family protein [Streptomyces hyaluromycini]